jgi:hypothetical protein
MTSMTQRVYDLLAAGASVQAITAELKIPPSRLKRIINSPSYRKQAELETMVTEENARLRMMDLSYAVIERVAQLTNGDDENAARMACIFTLNKALGIPAPEEFARAQSFLKTAATLVKMTGLSTKRYSSVQNGIGEQERKPRNDNDL